MVESHDAGMYKNEDAYHMLSKMQKQAYEEFKDSIALAEIFVEMRAEQAEKEANKTKKEANKKKRHDKKNRGKGRK